MRRRTALALALPIVALGAVAAVLVASGSGDEGDGATATARHGGTEIVRRRTLVDRAQLDGTLGYASPAPAMDRLDGTITWLPSAGAVIRPGGRLFTVDDDPVVLMDGAVPAWRTLAAGVSDGVDVQQLERGLAALGYDPGAVDERYSAATAAAVERWQGALGLPPTGRVELGRIVFLRGPRRVAQVQATLGSTGAGGVANASVPADVPGAVSIAYGGGGPAPSATTSPPAASEPPLPATTPTAPAPAPAPATTPTMPATTPTVPKAAPPAPAATVPQPAPGAPSAGGDGSGSAAVKILSTTSTARVVTADLAAADQGLARVGVRAVVTLPDGRRLTGQVVRVGTVVRGASADGGASGSDGGGGDPTLPLTIRLRSARAAGRLDEVPVTVELARTTRRDVLAVPIAALLARAGGGYAVRVVRGASVESVHVQPGLFADGYVELSGGGVHAGDRVEVPR